VQSRPAQVQVQSGTGTAQIVNLSTRGIVASGENALIAGFVISGTTPKRVLVLGWGLNLSRRFGVSGAIARPQLTLYRESTLRAQNSDWQLNAAELTPLIRQVGAQPLSESTDVAYGDAGFVVTLEPGGYSVVVAPHERSANQDGVGLIEVYDVTPNDGSRLVNLSTRGRVEQGDRQMIVGVVVGGSGRARLLIRGIGPSLAQFGLSGYARDPSEAVVRLQSGTSATVASNDDWWNSPTADQVVALSKTAGAFQLTEGSRDAAVLYAVEPGSYTTIVSPGDAQAGGVVLAEIYLADGP
jgi:hypothetical protein